MSSSESTHIELSDTGAMAWTQLADQVDALIAAWESCDEPPELTSFVPTLPGKMRSMIIVELIKVDLEFRWNQKRGQKKLEEYAAEFPELSVGGLLPNDLIYE